jgi:hypothetical protein
MGWQLPRVLFVLGKGGVGRSTVAAALGAELARRGERTLVFGWTVSDPIGPWFGLPPSGLMPQEVRPRLHAANYRLDATLRLYFVEHLRLPRFYRHVIDGKHVRKLIEASPGIAELFFIGHLWWRRRSPPRRPTSTSTGSSWTPPRPAMAPRSSTFRASCPRSGRRGSSPSKPIASRA